MIQLAPLAKLPFQLLLRVIKGTWNAITSVVAKPIYEQSDNLYQARRQQRSWDPLFYGVTYKLFLASVLTNDPHPASRIYVRNETNEIIDKIELCVVAEEANFDYPEIVTVHRLHPDRVARIERRNIPLQDVFVEEDGIRLSYGGIRVFATEVVRRGKIERINEYARIMRPTYTDFLNGKWSRRWGKLYNMDEIEAYKSDINDYLSFHVCPDFWAFRSDLPHFLRSIAIEYPYLLIPNKWLCWFLSRGWVLSVICWTPLLLRVRKIADIAASRK